MNFDYIMNVEPKTAELAELYKALYFDIEKAENLYWSEPQKSGLLLRKATEKICQIYNSYYEIGFSKNTMLEDYLCYTAENEHNVMVSRFLSSVRTEQRDRLEWLRVLGDECIFMDANPEKITQSEDKLYLNVKKMMFHMSEVTREMCVRIDGMENLEKIIFDETILPGYQTEEERLNLEEQKKKEEKRNFFAFWKKNRR